MASDIEEFKNCINAVVTASNAGLRDDVRMSISRGTHMMKRRMGFHKYIDSFLIMSENHIP